mgnify:CR=1 FL=1
METIVATVKNVMLFNEEFGGKLRLTLDKKLKGFVRKEDGTFEQADVDYISINAGAATAQLCAISDDIAIFRGTRRHGFTQAHWATALLGARVTFNHTFVKAGDKHTNSDETAEHDCYDDVFTDCVLTQRALGMIDRILIAAMTQDD